MENIAYKSLATLENKHWWFVARRKILTQFLTNLKLENDAKILEVGAGTGGNIDMLKQFGCVTALEGSSVALEHLKHKKDIKIIASYLTSELQSNTEKYDLIVLFDVLEHIENDDQALDILEKKLKPNGKLLITVPALKSLWSDHDVTHHHHRRYTLNELKKLISNKNLKINRGTYFNTFLFPLIFIARFSLSFFKSKKIDQVRPPNKIVNYVFTKIFSSEKYILSHFNLPIGVSILLEIEKKDKI